MINTRDMHRELPVDRARAVWWWRETIAIQHLQYNLHKHYIFARIRREEEERGRDNS